MAWQFNSTGAGFMVGSLAILIIVGVIFNNLTNTGFTNTNAYSPPNCVGTPTCNISGGVTTCSSLNCPAFSSVQGCTVPSQCQLGATTFLNAQSPFTYLFQGNLVGFFSSVFNSGETQNAIYSSYTTCIPLNGNIFFNATGMNIHNFMCQGISSVNSTNFKPVVDVPMNATSNGGNNSVWYSTGCEFFKNNQSESRCIVNSGNDGFASWNGTNAQNSFYAFYVLNGTSIGKSASCTIFSTNPACQIIMPWLYTNGVTTFTCPSTAHVNGLNINRTSYYCLMPVINPNTATSSLPNIFSFWSFIFGAIILFLGLGIALTSAVIGFSLNAQGTRMAQVFGLGLFIFSPFFSEFGGWLLPGVIGVFSPFAIFLVGGLFFFGIFSQTTAGGTAGS